MRLRYLGYLFEGLAALLVIVFSQVLPPPWSLSVSVGVVVLSIVGAFIVEKKIQKKEGTLRHNDVLLELKEALRDIRSSCAPDRGDSVFLLLGGIYGKVAQGVDRFTVEGWKFYFDAKLSELLNRADRLTERIDRFQDARYPEREYAEIITESLRLWEAFSASMGEFVRNFLGPMRDRALLEPDEETRWNERILVKYNTLTDYLKSIRPHLRESSSRIEISDPRLEHLQPLSVSRAKVQ